MKAGLLDRRLTIQRAAYTLNAFNEKVATWNDLMTVWASKRDVSDGERINAQQVAAHITTRFQFRWSIVGSSVNPTDRLYFEGLYYEIFSCKEITRRKGIEITAAARAEELIDDIIVSSAISSGVGSTLSVSPDEEAQGEGGALGIGSSISAGTGASAGTGG